jgi:hypothetical protein
MRVHSARIRPLPSISPTTSSKTLSLSEKTNFILPFEE